MFEQNKNSSEYVHYTTHVYQNTDYVLFTDQRSILNPLFGLDMGQGADGKKGGL